MWSKLPEVGDDVVCRPGRSPGQTVSVHSLMLVVPMALGDWLVTVQLTWSGWPLLAVAPALTEETTRSA